MSEAQTSEFQLPVPGAQHELMKPFEGTFKAAVKIWMGPGEPHLNTGTMNNRWILNGLYLEQDYRGDAVDGPFPNFEGHGFWGYNFAKECYEGFWIDTVSSQMQLESGTVDESGKIWTMTSEFQCPGAGTMKKRSVITLVDQDHHKIESFISGDDGNEFKNMEIEYSRIS